jgi:hypothetical protein
LCPPFPKMVCGAPFGGKWPRLPPLQLFPFCQMPSCAPASPRGWGHEQFLIQCWKNHILPGATRKGPPSGARCTAAKFVPQTCLWAPASRGPKIAGGPLLRRAFRAPASRGLVPPEGALIPKPEGLTRSGGTPTRGLGDHNTSPAQFLCPREAGASGDPILPPLRGGTEFRSPNEKAGFAKRQQTLKPLPLLPRAAPSGAWQGFGKIFGIGQSAGHVVALPLRGAPEGGTAQCPKQGPMPPLRGGFGTL